METVFTQSMTTCTNVYGWSPHGFDPDKNQPSWRQYLIDACEFVSECAHQDVEAAQLADFAELWLPKLRQHAAGFVPSSPADMADLAAVVADYTDYEEINGRFDRLVSSFAFGVLSSTAAFTHPDVERMVPA